MTSQRYVVSTTRVLDATVEEVWDVVSDTCRYADWVCGVLEVTRHHGAAVVGQTYEERNRTVGPLTSRSTWTVISQTEPTERIDAGAGLSPLRNLLNVFRFSSVNLGRSTEMAYEVRFDLPRGPWRPLIATFLTITLRRDFQASMKNLDDLIRSERPVGVSR